ncbi:MAG: hypothetical protein PHP00_01035 [Thiotrichaceae bacterium]|nr:hypothetical protein [Thiotrichaceae bacterium]
MSNTYGLKKPLSPQIEGVLTTISRICECQKIPYFVVGATARDIILSNVFGCEHLRKTLDIDIAISICTWNDWERLKIALITGGCQKVSVHRLSLKAIDIDIIPLGDIAIEGKIYWPPDQKTVMNIEGFQEAFDRGVVEVTLGNGVKIPVCSIASLALLKLVAWLERGSSNKKDAIDIKAILCNYHYTVGEDIYGDNIPADTLGHNLDRMGAYLLGINSRELITIPSGCFDILQKLQTKELVERLVDAIGTQSAFRYEDEEDDDIKVPIKVLIEDFWAGFNSAT